MSGNAKNEARHDDGAPCTRTGRHEYETRAGERERERLTVEEGENERERERAL